MNWTVTVPLPPQECAKSRIHTQHWSTKARAVREYREQCRWYFFDAFFDYAGMLPLKRITVSYRVFCGPDPVYRFRDGRYRPKDADNALFSFHTIQDSLVDIGVVKDDTAEFVRLGGIEVRRGSGERCGVEVTISEWNEEESG